MIKYSLNDFLNDVPKLARKINPEKYDFIYGVPKGGVPLAMHLSRELGISLTDYNPSVSDGNVLVVDDVIDSGATRERYEKFDFACLHVKYKSKGAATYCATEQRIGEKEWVRYWWEGEERPAEDAIIRMIQAIGDTPNREGMKETPKRVIKSWEQLFSGYEINSKEMFKQFSSDGYDELVLLKDVEFFSFCEHHMLPFFGKAHIAYIPNKKVVGISKLARLLDMYSRRFQIQERIGEQVTKDIMKHLDAQGAACIIQAQHLCMRMRGVNKQHSIMITSSMKGAFLNKPAARAELMSLIK